MQRKGLFVIALVFIKHLRKACKPVFNRMKPSLGDHGL